MLETALFPKRNGKSPFWGIKMKKVIISLCCAALSLLALGGCGGDASAEQRSFIEKNQGRSWDNVPSRQKAISANKQMTAAVAKKQ
ncbi:MAG: hypothetical protein Q8Q10_00055 [bacterium]|nr:hypothetical protein [bacterium]